MWSLPAQLSLGAEICDDVVVHHPRLAAVLPSHLDDLALKRLRDVLTELGTLSIGSLANGLPQAASLGSGSQSVALGYDHVWTRDAALIANAWCETNEPERAARAVGSLLDYYGTAAQRDRLTSGRPHIKFVGPTLSDMQGPWGHAQNDALGLLLWVALRLASGGVSWTPSQRDNIAALFHYLHRIQYWRDREYGHWEEAGEKNGKVSASSIGCVLAAVRAARHQRVALDVLDEIDEMEAEGALALAQLLPAESRDEGIYDRPADLALTTLLYLDVCTEPERRLMPPDVRDEVLRRTDRHLCGQLGHRRYAGDGYWAAYEDERDTEQRLRATDWSLEERLRRGFLPGTEAQWTMGAPLLAFIYRRLHRETADARWHTLALHMCRRAVGLVTGPASVLGPGVLPESYIVVRDGEGFRFRENPLPLNWAKANLRLAVCRMEYMSACS